MQGHRDQIATEEAEAVGQSSAAAQSKAKIKADVLKIMTFGSYSLMIIQLHIPNGDGLRLLLLQRSDVHQCRKNNHIVHVLLCC